MTEQKTNATASQKREKVGAELNFAAREAYKLLRTNIEFSFTDHEKGKVIGFTSPCPQEGKSHTAINFCYALAEAGKKVILIDGDMRRPTIPAKLGLVIVDGLSDAVVGKTTIEEAIRPNVLDMGFDVLGSGNLPPNPAELIGSKQMQEILDRLTGQYDYVVMDLPPVNSVSDPLIVSKYLDGAVVVVKHRHTRQSEVRECIRRLRFLQVRLLGFVYNGAGGNGRLGKGGKYEYDYYRTEGKNANGTPAPDAERQ